jgi:hypothetical protein
LPLLTLEKIKRERGKEVKIKLRQTFLSGIAPSNKRAKEKLFHHVFKKQVKVHGWI